MSIPDFKFTVFFFLLLLEDPIVTFKLEFPSINKILLNAKKNYVIIFEEKKCDEEELLLAFGQMRCQKLCILYSHILNWALQKTFNAMDFSLVAPVPLDRAVSQCCIPTF